MKYFHPIWQLINCHSFGRAIEIIQFRNCQLCGRPNFKRQFFHFSLISLLSFYSVLGCLRFFHSFVSTNFQIIFGFFFVCLSKRQVKLWRPTHTVRRLNRVLLSTAKCEIWCSKLVALVIVVSVSQVCVARTLRKTRIPCHFVCLSFLFFFSRLFFFFCVLLCRLWLCFN